MRLDSGFCCIAHLLYLYKRRTMLGSTAWNVALQKLKMNSPASVTLDMIFKS